MAARTTQVILQENADLKREIERLKAELRRSNPDVLQLEIDRLRRLNNQYVEQLAQADVRVIRFSRRNMALVTKNVALEAENNALHEKLAPMVAKQIITEFKANAPKKAKAG